MYKKASYGCWVIKRGFWERKSLNLVQRKSRTWPLQDGRGGVELKRHGVEWDFGHEHSLLAAGKEEKRAFPDHGTTADFGGHG